MLQDKNSAVLIINDDLTSSTIFSPLVLSDITNIKLVVFDGKLISKEKGILSGALSLFRRISKRYWIYQSFIMLFYRLVSFSPFVYKIPEKYLTLRQICRKRDIPYMTCKNINNDDFVKKINALAVGRLFIRCSQILRKHLIETVRGEVYCVHSSLLPSYKGIAAEFHAIVNDERIIGTSIFKVEERLDAGEVLYQDSLKINESNSHYWHVMQNNILSSKMLISFVSSNCSKKQLVTEKVITESYYSWPMPEDMKVFKMKKKKLIRINEIVSIVFSLFRGFGRDL